MEEAESLLMMNRSTISRIVHPFQFVVYDNNTVTIFISDEPSELFSGIELFWVVSRVSRRAFFVSAPGVYEGYGELVQWHG